MEGQAPGPRGALSHQPPPLAARFERVSYEWIPRAQNSHADRLANEAMDAAAQAAGADDPEPVDRTDPTGQRPATGETPGNAAGFTPAGWTGARGAPTRLLLLRHGQTELSAQRRYSGRGNPALTDIGRQQADAAARYLADRGGIAAVISSPLQRAYDTAAAAAKALGSTSRSTTT